jgi:hypothetical protein
MLLQIVKVDTVIVIKKVHDTITVTAKDYQPIELINKVDSFYNSAWSKLTVTVTLLFIIVGIVIPLIIQWYQKKQLKLSEENLINDIDVKIFQSLSQLELKIDTKSVQSLEQLKADVVRESEENLIKLKEEIKSEYDEFLAVLRKENEESINDLKKLISHKQISSMTHLQGLMSCELKEFEDATFNFLFALYYSLKGKGTGHKTFINNLKFALEKSDKTELEEYFTNKNQDFLKTLKEIKELNRDEALNEQLDEVQTIFENLE